MSELDRSRYFTVTRESVEAAEEEAKRYMGGPLRLKKGERYYFRFMPAFKVNAQGLPQWWSQGMRHYGVPIIGQEEGKRVTMDCPKSKGARCIPCENSGVFKQMGAWDDFKGCSPRKRVYFNVIDIQNLDAGVQILEDGPKLWGLLREEFLNEEGDGNPLLFDPFEGSVIIVYAKDQDPWRKLVYPEKHQCSLEEIHENALVWGLPENLNNLDDVWDFPSLEEQQETFSFLQGITQLAAPAPKAQIPEQVQPSPGISAILDEASVIEGEVVEEEAATAEIRAPAPALVEAPQPLPNPAGHGFPAPPAPAPAEIVFATVPAPAPVEAPAPAPASVEAPAPAPAAATALSASAKADATVAAIIAEANANASPVPDDAAPAPAPTAAPVAGGGSSVLSKYQTGMEEVSD